MNTNQWLARTEAWKAVGALLTRYPAPGMVLVVTPEHVSPMAWGASGFPPGRVSLRERDKPVVDHATTRNMIAHIAEVTSLPMDCEVRVGEVSRVEGTHRGPYTAVPVTVECLGYRLLVLVPLEDA